MYNSWNNSKSGFCTGWRVGEGNKMFTNNHCVNEEDTENDLALKNIEIWFNYQRSTCGGRSDKTVTKVTGN